MYMYMYIEREIDILEKGDGQKSKHRRVKRSLFFATNPVVPPQLGVI